MCIPSLAENPLSVREGRWILIVLFFQTSRGTYDVFTVILNDGTDLVTGQFTTGASITVGDHQFTISYNANLDGGGIGNDVALTYLVPEPGSAPMLLGGFATLIGLGRTRRRL